MDIDEDFKPKIYRQGSYYYVEFLLRAEKCPCCGKYMVEEHQHGVFPYYCRGNQESQMEKSGIVFISFTEVDGKRICIECNDSGKADIKCSLCEKRKKTDMVEESIGWPPDYLCKDCYKTVTAKVWDDKVEELNEEHQYDFE